MAGFGLGGFVARVSRRLIQREPGAGGRARLVARGSALALVLAALALALGLRGPVVVAGLWLASLVAMVAALIVRLRPMLVVAVLGLALGVASLFVVLGVASGIEGTLVSSLARLNGHAMVSKYGLDFYEFEEVAAQLERDPRVRAASPFVFGVGAIVVVPDEGAPESEQDEHARGPVVVTIKGVDPERLAGFSSADELFAAGGLASLRPAGPRVRPGIVLGTRLAHRIGAGLGARVRVVVPASIRGDEGRGEDIDAQELAPRHGEFEVLGLLDTGFAEFDASFVLMHITAGQALVFGQLRASGIELELDEPRLGQALPVASELVARLNRPRAAAGKPPLYRAATWADRSPTLTTIRQTKALILVVLSLIILVASGSLLGALLLLVRRERRHIGVLAALGATPRQLFWIFELVGVGIGVLGSLLGLAWGAVSLLGLSLLRFELDPSIYMIDHLPVRFVIEDVVVPSVIAILVCAVVTGPVARRVSRIRPIELVR